MKGVIAGVRDYGNKMGIPTVNGAIVFDKHFVGNPLVFCGNIGLIPKGKDTKKVSKGDLIVAVGGRTGRDGIHGATFSSGELTSESETISSGAVQIGNPIEEKKVLDALLKARKLICTRPSRIAGPAVFLPPLGRWVRKPVPGLIWTKLCSNTQGLRVPRNLDI